MADSCCLSMVAFGQNVKNSLRLEVLDSGCQARLIVQQLPACDSVYFIDWGDGNLDYGPYSNGTLTHTYIQTGSYTIQVPVVEFDADGGPCFDTLVKYRADVHCSCDCGTYSLSVNINGIHAPIPCGGVFSLACPAPASLDITGFINCTGNACPVSPIQWTLSGPDVNETDSAAPGDFQVKLPPLERPGNYELKLHSQCGTQSCTCNIILHLSPCLPVDVCPDFCPGSTWNHFNATRIQDMVVYNSQLIVAGSFKTIGREELPVDNIAAWNGNTWSVLEGGGLNNVVNDLEVHDGILYAGGEFTQAGNQAVDKIAAWDGSSWSALNHGGINGNFTNVDALLATSGGLIVGGKFTSVGNPALTVSNIAAWNPGTGWASMGTSLDGPVFSLAIFNGNIVAGGRFGNIPGGLNNVALWDGNWTKLGQEGAVNIKFTTPNPGDGVHALVVYNDQLIAGGQFLSTMSDTAPGQYKTQHIAKWDGEHWSSLGNGIGVQAGNGIYSLMAFNNDLLAGGQFTRMDNKSINLLAKWDGTQWTSLGHPASGAIRAMNIYGFQNDLPCSLYTGGELGMNQWSCSSVAVTNQNPSSRISLFPNPASSHFFIEVDDNTLAHGNVEIYSLLGRKLMDQKISRIQPGEPVQVALNGLGTGTYLVKISGIIGSTIRKIIICE